MAWDHEIIEILNRWFVSHPEFHRPLYLFATSDLPKGILFIALFVALWHRRPPSIPVAPGPQITRSARLEQQSNGLPEELAGMGPRITRSARHRSSPRRPLFLGFMLLLLALASNRLLASLLPFRPRPSLLTDTWLPLSNIPPRAFSSLSSFPSDHAVFFIGLSLLFATSSRLLSLAALLYTSLFILFPRLLLGFHYPTDLLAGALIAVLFLSPLPFLRRHSYLSPLWEPFSLRFPSLFSFLFFLLLLLSSLLFDPLIRLL